MKNCEPIEVAKPTIVQHIKRKVGSVKYWVQGVIAKTGMALIRLSVGQSNYIDHAKREFEHLGWPGDCEMQETICNEVLDLLYLFADSGHSGSSAPYAIGLFKTLAAFEPIGPLTGKDSEWGESCWNDGTMQNKRCSHVFKEKDGRAYDINGKVFKESNGSCYTSRESRVYIEFPYVPKTEYVTV